ncbi:hypothetical protein K0B96_10045 [Horticoccus luteus]|uniref:Uncharacterized protein n=1 Tax=Horticoccus luteus TaxID=2862869 RepID=A0A8F9XJZ4_9BACT|nr:hypothetical protein [Horticoccus luteus]QYM77666.1 hypothetical protein K0B96_10045 [Horticoccus luteus]
MNSPSHPPAAITEVRYSLPAMLAEIRAERSAGAMAMDKLEQQEITKLFKSRNARRRAKPQK